MRIIFYIPPLSRPSGGLTNIYACAANLAALGRGVALCGPDANAPGFAEAVADGLPALSWSEGPGPGDVWCIPEGWPNALPPGLKAGARILVYVQNWVHMLDTLPQGVTWKQLPLEYVAVSRPVAAFLERIVGVKPLCVVPPVVDEAFFRENNAHEHSPMVRAAWMPRKNKALGEQARRVCEMRLRREPSAPALQWVTIDKMPREEVARALASCHLFLSTGFPEGFALPPAEAMAAGCAVVGCTGFGGWEYMRQARAGDLVLDHGPLFASLFAPDIFGDTLRDDGENSRTGNGFYTPDGDSLATGAALARAVCLAAQNSPEWQKVRQAARATAARYTNLAQRLALASLLGKLDEA